MLKKLILASSLLALLPAPSALAQDILPADNGTATYHTAPRYRETESHPFRVVAYVVHPVGWLLREAIFRPWSYLVSSNETTKSIFGYREPFDYRTPECFSADDSAPDCRSVSPYNYDQPGTQGDGDLATGDAPVPASEASLATGGVRQVYFPDVNFDFDVRRLNDLGEGRARQIAQLLQKEPGLKVVLQGNADAVGSDKYNEKLGTDRAEALRSELIALGVPAERVSTVTFGESQPVFTDDTKWARAVNRRVEVHLEQ